MKRVVLLSMLVILFTSAIVCAVPDSVVTGPYKVSFDIGLARENYNVTVPAPVIDETLGGEKNTKYYVEIDNKTGGAFFIGILIIQLGKKGSPIPYTELRVVRKR